MKEGINIMEKIVLMNDSPNKSGNTFRIEEEILKGISHDILLMPDYKVRQYGHGFHMDLDLVKEPMPKDG